MIYSAKALSLTFHRAASLFSSAHAFWRAYHRKHLDNRLAQITRQRTLTDKERRKVFQLIQKGADVRGPLNEAIFRDAHAVVSALLQNPKHYFLINPKILSAAKKQQLTSLYTIRQTAQKLGRTPLKPKKMEGGRPSLRVVGR